MITKPFLPRRCTSISLWTMSPRQYSWLASSISSSAILMANSTPKQYPEFLSIETSIFILCFSCNSFFGHTYNCGYLFREIQKTGVHFHRILRLDQWAFFSGSIYAVPFTKILYNLIELNKLSLLKNLLLATLRPNI